MYTRGESIDLMTVTNKLRKNGDLEMAGGPYKITIHTGRVLSPVGATQTILTGC